MPRKFSVLPPSLAARCLLPFLPSAYKVFSFHLSLGLEVRPRGAVSVLSACHYCIACNSCIDCHTCHNCLFFLSCIGSGSCRSLPSILGPLCSVSLTTLFSAHCSRPIAILAPPLCFIASFHRLSPAVLLCPYLCSYLCVYACSRMWCMWFKQVSPYSYRLKSSKYKAL
jgi:hypothetical protein